MKTFLQLNMKLFLTILVLLSINSFGQKSPKSKTTIATIGVWKFKPFYRKFDDGEKALQEIWVIMKISFSEQGYYKSILLDSIIEEGKWDISEDGKALILSERTQTPQYREELLPLKFPVKTKQGKYIKLMTKEEGKDIEIEFLPDE